MPYDNCRVTQDWLDAWRNVAAFRVLSHSVKIEDYQPLQEGISAVSTTVQSQFVQNPYLWIYTDPQRLFRLRAMAHE